MYGLGAILYELITGRPPFKGADFVETLDQVRKQEPVSPRILQPKLPRDIETICLKCLQKDPAKRYASADALAEDLERFLEHKPIAARPVGGVERAWRWTKRNPAVSGLMAAVVLVLVGGSAVSAFFAYRAETERRTADDERRTADDERIRALAREQDANAARVALGLEGDKLRKEQEYTRRLLYTNQMNAASEAYNDGRIPRLVQILEQTKPKPNEPDLRGWEWHHLDRITRAEAPALVLAKPGEPGYQPMMRVDSYMTNEGVLSADGSRLAMLAVKNQKYAVVVWDASTGRRLGVFPPEGPTLTFDTEDENVICALSPNGSHVALLGPNPWDRPPQQFGPFPPSGGTRTLRIWEVATGRPQKVPQLEIGALSGQNGTLTVGPDGTWVQWFESPPPMPQVLGFGAPFNLIQVEGIGHEMLMEHGRFILRSRFDVAKGVVKRMRIESSKNHIFVLQTAGEVALLASAATGPLGGSMNETTYSVWNVAADPPVRLREYSPPPNFRQRFQNPTEASLSPDGKVMALYSGDVLTLAHVPEPGKSAPPNNTISVPAEGITRLRAVSDRGRCVFTRPNSLLTVTPGNTPEAMVNQSVRHHRDGALLFSAFHPGGELLTVAGDGPILRRWNLDSTPNFTPNPSQSKPEDRIISSPDGSRRVIWKFASQFAEKNEQKPLLIEDAKTGMPSGRIEVAPGAFLMDVRFVAGGRRILVNMNRPP